MIHDENDEQENGGNAHGCPECAVAVQENKQDQKNKDETHDGIGCDHLSLYNACHFFR